MTQSLDPFKTALQFTLQHEGGVGHPNDLGGTVNRGITQASYDIYRQRQGLPQQSVSQILDAEVEEIYYDYYWKPSKAESMCLPLAIVHFDTAVNFSLKGSIEFLQEALGGLTVDGDFGRRTTAALEKANNLETAQRYCQARIAYRRDRVNANPSQEIFLEGWLKRDNDLLRYISNLSGETRSDRNDDVIEKLEQAIDLLQEIVVSLKKSK